MNNSIGWCLVGLSNVGRSGATAFTQNSDFIATGVDANTGSLCGNEVGSILENLQESLMIKYMVEY